MPSSLKALLPVWLKKIPWYIFKSPQRSIGFSYSLVVEMRGASHFLARRMRRMADRKLQPVCISTGIKDRTDNYLQYVLPSILRMKHPELIEISIFDCGSADAERLYEGIKAKWKGKLHFHSESHPFSRAFAFNKAIAQAEAPLIFAADADLTLPGNLVQLCNRYVSTRTVWFPICFDLDEDKPAVLSRENGWWRPQGKGMFASTLKQFEHAGRFNEKYKSWGNEDWDLWFRFFEAGYMPIRTHTRGLFHHYHPSLRPDDFKPVF